MANESLFPQRWNDLPDPRPTAGASATAVIEVGEREWRKIVQKHFANPKEPWSEIAIRSVQNPLASDEKNEVTEAALSAVRNECAAALQKPLAILYSCVGPQIRGQGHRWILVLPSGALAIIWCENGVNRLKTCYFSGAVCYSGHTSAVIPIAKRWRRAVRQQVQENLVRSEQAGSFLYPRPEHRREVGVIGGTTEMRYSFRFVAADAWGFASSEPGAQWSLPNWNWESQKIRLGR